MKSVIDIDLGERQFRSFLMKHGYLRAQGEIVWTFIEDYIWENNSLYVCLQQLEGHSLRTIICDSCIELDFGLELRLVTTCEGLPLCSMFIPESTDEAEQMMISGIKLTIPSTLLPIVNVINNAEWNIRLSRQWKRQRRSCPLPSPIQDIISKRSLRR